MSPMSPNDLDRIFRNLDKNNKGLVTVHQLHHLLIQIGVHTITLEEVESLVGRPTLNYFDFLFFYEATIKSTLTITPASGEQDCDLYERDLSEAFKVFDLNGDGYISSEELRRVLLKLGLWDGATGQDCQDMIRVYDENRDGLLDFQEFKNMMMCNNS